MRSRKPLLAAADHRRARRRRAGRFRRPRHRRAAARDDVTTAAASTGGVKIAYYDQWSVYGNAFYPKHLDTRGIAGKLDVLNYSFGNIHPTDLTCFEANKAAGDDNNPNAGDGAGDSYADYQKSFARGGQRRRRRRHLEPADRRRLQPVQGAEGEVPQAEDQYLAGRLDVLQVLPRRGADRREPQEVRRPPASSSTSRATCRSRAASAARAPRPGSSTASTSTGSTRARPAATSATTTAPRTRPTSRCCSRSSASSSTSTARPTAARSTC